MTVNLDPFDWIDDDWIEAVVAVGKKLLDPYRVRKHRPEGKAEKLARHLRAVASR